MKQNIVKFPDRSVIAEEACAWLIKLDGDHAPSDRELRELREWLDRSPVHHEELKRLALFWNRLNVLTDLAVPLEKPDAGKKHSLIKGLRGLLPDFGPAGITAVSILAGFVLVLALTIQPDSSISDNGLYETAISQQQSWTFADGSTLLLNTNSQIRVDYDEQYRDVYLLKGEVYFSVAKNAERPFRVYAGNGRVQAVGTAFSVYLKDSAIDVTVTEGSVALASVNQLQESLKPIDRLPKPGASVEEANVKVLGMLEAGQSTTIRPAAHDQAGKHTSYTLDVIKNIDHQEMAKRTSWQRGLLTFAGEPLERVVDEISRYTTVSIEISDPAVKAIKIGGQFPVGKTDAMLDAFEVNFGLRVTRLDRDHVLLSAADDS